MKPQKKNPKVIVVCGFVVCIILFTLINIFNFSVYRFIYLIMLIIYFFKFLYNEKHKED